MKRQGRDGSQQTKYDVVWTATGARGLQDNEGREERGACTDSGREGQVGEAGRRGNRGSTTSYNDCRLFTAAREFMRVISMSTLSIVSCSCC